jgi:hypothetical protein
MNNEYLIKINLRCKIQFKIKVNKISDEGCLILNKIMKYSKFESIDLGCK